MPIQSERKTFKVLVVEDEPLIAMMVADALEAVGCEVVGPASRLDEAMEMASSRDLDCAILDINIRGAEIYPVADILLARGTPMLLASGYGDWTLPERLQGQRRLEKPYSLEEIEAEIRLLCARVSSEAQPQLS
jgi:DNA-binding response OmpR family regulator